MNYHEINLYKRKSYPDKSVKAKDVYLGLSAHAPHLPRKWKAWVGTDLTVGASQGFVTTWQKIITSGATKEADDN